MTPYEQMKPMMDAGVDTNLGDSIFYALAGEEIPAAPNKIGFLSRYAPEAGLRGVEGMKSRWTLKIARSQLPEDGPSRTHKLTSPKLHGVVMRPAVDTIDTDGDYWIMELQPR